MGAGSETPDPAPVSVIDEPSGRWPRWLLAALIGLVFVRVGYHGAYLVEVPFSLATFSDGRLYERAARDIMAEPPWGTEPFYLQGLYAYQLAVPMLVRPWISLALLAQLVLAGAALRWLYVAMRTPLWRYEAGLGLVVLMAYPGLSFYENKFLSASLAVVTMVLVLRTLAWVQRRPTPVAFIALGAAAGLAVLARGNMLLAIPGVVVAAALVGRGDETSRWAGLGWLTLGLMLAWSPMLVRNAVVGGRPSLLPAHGGGTSFYIGNNRHARGVWNHGGGLLSGDVARERSELVAALEISEGPAAEQIDAIGGALYRRAFHEIAESPGRWGWLELRKGWLLIGNDELSQDYDVAGERELLPWWVGWGIPFSVLLALGLVGVLEIRERTRADRVVAARWRPWWWVLGAQTIAVLAANLLFFTSAQHRLPLVVPLVVFIGPGLWGLRRRATEGRRIWLLRWALVVIVLGQGTWPRARHRGPSAVHYYNLALAHLNLGQPDHALAALNRAIEQRPDHPVFVLERAILHRRRGNVDAATADLDRLVSMPVVPAEFKSRIASERKRIAGLP